MTRTLERSTEYTIELGKELEKELIKKLSELKGRRKAKAREDIVKINQYVNSLTKNHSTRRENNINFIHDTFDNYLPAECRFRTTITERIKKRLQRR